MGENGIFTHMVGQNAIFTHQKTCDNSEGVFDVEERERERER